ncbi:MAG TPA: acyl-ACP--UDP-N-acetylglucosamine O-acyltransferase [Planctomycetes bacterium]|nr:acyl-ACP--UDP-N-acetylglucosamine O-acyltransferase [Planctomycetota bacterium]
MSDMPSTETRIHPTALVEKGVELGVGVEIGPFAILGEGVRIGDRTKVMGQAQILGRTTLGEDNVVFPGAILGCIPQDKKFRGEETRLVIGDRNHFREHCTAHRGTGRDHGGAGQTTIGNDNLLMACSHVAHDCILGDKVTMGNNVLLAGHVHVEEGATISGGTAIHQFTTIGTMAFIGGLARVGMDVPPYLIVEGRPGRVRGINLVGLRRRGVSEKAQEALKEAYRILFMNPQGNLEAGLDTLEAKEDLVEEVRNLVLFLRRNERGGRGRYLEGMRRDQQNESGDPRKSSPQGDAGQNDSDSSS